MKQYTPTGLLIHFLISNEYRYGDFISHKDVERATELKPLTNQMIEEEKMKADDIIQFINKHKIDLMTAVSGAAQYFLEKEQMLLVNVYGDGYQFVNPKDQVDRCLDSGLKLIKKGIKKQLKGIKHINHEKLSANESARARDVLAQVSTFNSMVNREQKRIANLKAIQFLS